jgi:Flp pilus assembly protein TadB
LSKFVTQEGITTADRLQEQMKQASMIKQGEEAASVDRMSRLLSIEERRQTELRRRTTKRNKEERRTIVIVGAAVIVFLLVVLLITLIGGGV